jgi:hypothetical protein
MISSSTAQTNPSQKRSASQFSNDQKPMAVQQSNANSSSSDNMYEDRIIKNYYREVKPQEHSGISDISYLFTAPLVELPKNSVTTNLNAHNNPPQGYPLIPCDSETYNLDYGHFSKNFNACLNGKTFGF